MKSAVGRPGRMRERRLTTELGVEWETAQAMLSRMIHSLILDLGGLGREVRNKKALAEPIGGRETAEAILRRAVIR